MSESSEMKCSRFDYSLDSSLIATHPLPERDHSRLLVYHRKRQVIEHRTFKDLPDYLNPADLLVFNDTRVFSARLRGKKVDGNPIELLLLRPLSKVGPKGAEADLCWEVMVKGKRKVPMRLSFEGGVSGTMTRDLNEGLAELIFDLSGSHYSNLFSFLEDWGEVPLPPYIVKRRTESAPMEPMDKARYQTVFAEAWGSAAAPTAGLHFTKALIESIRSKGIRTATTTLHIGRDTFQPLRCETLSEHQMHREWFQVPLSAAEAVNATRQKGGRVVAVGTTVTRALESAAAPGGSISAREGETDLFIRPGYRFQGLDALLTNFHQPQSTLLVLVTAFAGEEAVALIYRRAQEQRYRFFSYGDAMLIL